MVTVFEQGDLQKTAEIEGCVIDCLLMMVMKLSEVTFRPLFFKVCGTVNLIKIDLFNCINE